MVLGAKAGLAGGVNSPLKGVMGALFVMEELTRRFHPRLLWPSLLVCAAAALVLAAGIHGGLIDPSLALGRLACDQQWLLGILPSSVLGAHAGRCLQAEPIYHALREPHAGRTG